jgi:hypothetical protein
MIDQDRAKLQLAAVVGAVLGIVTVGADGSSYLSGRSLVQSLSAGFSVVNAARRFPPPWSVEVLPSKSVTAPGRRWRMSISRMSQGGDRQRSCSRKTRRDELPANAHTPAS